MLLLNLFDLKDSDIKYNQVKYPDGQQDLRLIDFRGGSLDRLMHQALKDGVQILSRFNHFGDLELILSAAAAIRRLDRKIEITLNIPYLFGARSDRKFVAGGNSYLVDVIAPILNAQSYREIRSLDVHSDVAQSAIPTLSVTSNATFIEWVLSQLNNDDPQGRQPVLVTPDGGALKKIYSLAEEITYTGAIVQATKHRDLVTGKVTETTVHFPESYAGQNLLIVDDILDGGRTFIELAKELRRVFDTDWFKGRYNNTTTAQPKIYLAVTHGLFSNGYTQLRETFDGIFTTDSIKEIPVKEDQMYGLPKATGVRQVSIRNVHQV